MTDQDCNLLTTSAATVGDLWCVYEHYMLFDPAAPPTLVYIASCKLTDVYLMREARNNSDWAMLASVGYPLMIRIVLTADDRSSAFNAAVARVKAQPTMPRCNLHGYNVFRLNRMLTCSNSKEYKSQTEAAQDLGCSQSAISQHLNGKIDSVKGYRLAWKVKE